MKKIYRNKKTADNEFTKLTGIVAVSIEVHPLAKKNVAASMNIIVGDNLGVYNGNCLVVKQKTISKPHFKRDVPIQKAAYCLYHGTNVEDVQSVRTSCGLKNCVAKECLFATLKKEAQPNFDAATDGWG